VLTLDHNQVPSTQTNFPVVAWNGFTLGSSRIQNASCFDVIFTGDSAGTTKIPWEVESCNQSTGAMVAHFLVASLSSSADTKVYVSYDNGSVSTAQNTGANGPTHVWDSNYVRVYHLADNAATTAVVDSTTTQNGVSTANTSTLQAAGEVNGSLNLGTSDYFSQGGALAFTGATAAWTLSAWFKTTAGDAQIFGLQNNSTRDPVIDLGIGQSILCGGLCNGSGSPGFYVQDNTASGGAGNNTTVTALNDGAWHYLVLTRDSSKNLKVYADCSGTPVFTATDTMGTGQTFDLVGGNIGEDTIFFGARSSTMAMDEARISITNRSANWITAECNNQKLGSSFIAVGGEQ
jgi:hypothetical protein